MSSAIKNILTWYGYFYTRIFNAVIVVIFKVHNEFILPSEKEGFIYRMGDIIKRAESLMAKGQPVHSSGHRLPQPPFHSGANSLSSSQVSNPSQQHCYLRNKGSDSKASLCFTALCSYQADP